MSGPALVLGGSGRLGAALREELARRGRDHAAPARAELDLARLDALDGRVAAFRPSAIVDLAAFTDVAAAERPESRAAVFLLNRDVPEALARIAARLGVPFVHVSTDYVFDGAKRAPYVEEDPTHPLQVYGGSKLEGERAVLGACPGALVLRVSTLFGPGVPSRPAYVDAVLAQALPYERGKGTLEVVEAPVSSPTYAPDAAAALLDLLDRGASGLVHTVNRGSCSRLELARATVAACYLADRVIVTPKPAPEGGVRRPDYSVLSTARLESLLGRRLPTWRDALTRYIERLRVGG